MTYSTGSGDYVALIAAVLAHCVTDGWTTSSGDWPISKGVVRGVDWDTYTENDNDQATGSAVPHTTRWVNFAVGTSLADATVQAQAGNGSHVPNMEYTFDEWHIFSDPGVGKPDYVSVVVKFSNGPNPDVYGHFSFGEINKHGMTYGGCAYATTHPVRGFPWQTFTQQIFASDYACGPYARNRRAFTGRLGFTYNLGTETKENFTYLIDPTNSPFPVSPVWPQPDIQHGTERILDTYSPGNGAFAIGSTTRLGNVSCKFSSTVGWARSQLYSGGVSLAPFPLFVANGTTNSQTLQFMSLGSVPDVRFCSVENFSPGDEINHAGETWVLFPMLRRTPYTQMGISLTVSSGYFGFAYKKVV